MDPCKCKCYTHALRRCSSSDFYRLVVHKLKVTLAALEGTSFFGLNLTFLRKDMCFSRLPLEGFHADNCTAFQRHCWCCCWLPADSLLPISIPIMQMPRLFLCVIASGDHERINTTDDSPWRRVLIKDI